MANLTLGNEQVTTVPKVEVSQEVQTSEPAIDFNKLEQEAAATVNNLQSIGTVIESKLTEKEKENIKEVKASKSKVPEKKIETADWKEYKSTELKLTFKVPLNMNVNIEDNTITIQDYPFNAPPPDPYYKAVFNVSNGSITDTKVDKKDKVLTDQIISTFKFE